jgi:phytoene dehydrogenase-like protein
MRYFYIFKTELVGIPVDGLYLCSAATHPGGGVTGINGRNASRQILKDLK